MSISPHVGSAPLKLDITVHYDEQEFRGAAGCIIVAGPEEKTSCWEDGDGIGRSPIIRRFELRTPGDYEVWAGLGRVLTGHQAVRVN